MPLPAYVPLLSDPFSKNVSGPVTVIDHLSGAPGESLLAAVLPKTPATTTRSLFFKPCGPPTFISIGELERFGKASIGPTLSNEVLSGDPPNVFPTSVTHSSHVHDGDCPNKSPASADVGNSYRALS